MAKKLITCIFLTLMCFPAFADEMPDILIKISGGHASVSIEADDMTISGTEFDPVLDCLAGKIVSEVNPAVDELIESGTEKKDKVVPVKEHVHRMIGLYSVPGRNKITFTAKKNGISIDGDPSEYDHLVIEDKDGIQTCTGKDYRGRMEIIHEKGKLILINRITLEEYLNGMLDSEMSNTWPVEALKAQAVAARTYALFQKYYGGRCHYDMESGVLSQVYKGLAHEHDSTIKAVEETAGQVLTKGGEPIMALYHSCCGGATQDNADVYGKKLSYLRSVKCQYDSACPWYRWDSKETLKGIQKDLEESGLYKGQVRSVRFDDKGRVAVTGTSGGANFRPEQLRAACGYSVLPSGMFTVKVSGGKVYFNGRGAGHGVGMCQWGARGLAERSRDYRQILQQYYKGAEITKLY